MKTQTVKEPEIEDFATIVKRWKDQVKRGLVTLASEPRYEDAVRKGRELGVAIPRLADIILEANRERAAFGVGPATAPEPVQVQVTTSAKATSIDPGTPGSEYLLLLNRLTKHVVDLKISVPDDLRTAVNIALENLLDNRRVSHKGQIEQLKVHLGNLLKEATSCNNSAAGVPSNLAAQISDTILEIEKLRSMPTEQILGDTVVYL